MKKLALFILGIVLCATITKAQILTGQYINFPDTNFRNALLNHKYMPIIDLNNDKLIDTSEAKQVTYLYLYETKINDLSGIEFFTNLDTLKCYSNKLYNIDISKNIKLLYFDCSYNYYISNLDISNNLNLTYLNCNQNKIKNLDVSKNINLIKLICANNQLSSIDVSNNINLTGLSCDNNKLSNLDVSKNILLQGLGFSNNLISNIDLIKNINLETVVCSSNLLTSIDLSKNVNLTTLHCYSNQLTSIDVSNNTKLWDFDCSNNKLTTLDINKNIKLVVLKCSDNQLTTLDLYYDTLLSFLHIENMPTLIKVCWPKISPPEFVVFDNNSPNVKYQYCNVGFKEEVEEQFKIFPNPVINKLNIETGKNNSEIIIYNIFGKIVIKQKLINGENIININNNIPSGIYFYEIITKDKLVKKNKIIINH